MTDINQHDLAFQLNEIIKDEKRTYKYFMLI